MESYYSSDEDIAWGPLTLREIKRELERPPRKINRRESDFGSYSYLESNLNSSGTSAYFTPNETFQPDPSSNKNVVFLKKIAKVIEGENNKDKEICETVLDGSKVNPVSDSLMKILNSDERYSQNLDNIEQSLIENTIQYSPCDRNRVMEHNSTIEQYIDESEATISEADIIVISDESSDESVEHIYPPVDHLIKKEKHLEESIKKNLSEIEGDSDIVDIELKLRKLGEKQQILRSTDSDSSEKESEDNCYKKFVEIIKDISQNETYEPVETEENISRNDLLTLNAADDRLLNSTTHINTSSQRSIIENDKSPETSSSQPLDLGIEEEEEELDLKVDDRENENNLNEKFQHMNVNISEIGRLSIIQSPAEDTHHGEFFMGNPASSLASYESESTDYGNKSESFIFNDTLEEMDMILKQGINYVNTGSCSSEDREQSSIQEELVIMKKPIGTIKKRLLKTPTKRFGYIQSPIGEYIKKTPVADFKLPSKLPIKNKMTPNSRSPLIQQSKAFKNIISPVGLYIKNNPGVCLKQNIPVKTVTNLQFVDQGEAIKSNKENISRELPAVIYKPAKKVVSSVKKDDNVVLPSNIKKLVPERIVTKHETRVKSVVNNSVVSRKLLEGDLTTTTVDGSLLGDDVSFVTVQQAFIK